MDKGLGRLLIEAAEDYSQRCLAAGSCPDWPCRHGAALLSKVIKMIKVNAQGNMYNVERDCQQNHTLVCCIHHMMML